MTTRRVGLRTETYRLGQIKLLRDDLMEIAKVVAEVGPLTIRCGDWEMTEPADLADNSELPAKLPEVVMAATKDASDTTVVVTLGPTAAMVELTEPDTLLDAVLSRIQRIAQSRVRLFPPFGDGAVLINVFRAERSTFWRRTKDDWIIGVVMLLLGGVLGYVVNVIT